jgi:structure-specific endonuclease subunit SLX1
MGDQVVEEFHGCYLLKSSNSKFINRTYIGYTVNPSRRVNQHNAGSHAGGARRTSQRGPWVMILMVHGFPNMISALRFEWAWQHPRRSRRLRQMVSMKRKNEKNVDYCFRILTAMLRTGPWNRLPLTIQWLEQECETRFPVPTEDIPPIHMAIAYGPVKTKRVTSRDGDADDSDDSDCHLCSMQINASHRLQCLRKDCRTNFHTTCLARAFTQGSSYLLPVEGSCPACSRPLLWGDLVRYKKGCYRNSQDTQLETLDLD